MSIRFAISPVKLPNGVNRKLDRTIEGVWQAVFFHVLRGGWKTQKAITAHLSMQSSLYYNSHSKSANHQRKVGILRTSPYRVGIDIVNVQHIQDSLDRFGDRFLKRIFTSEEQLYCQSLASANATAQSLAARFAAKEATIKVLRPGDVALDWRTIEICRSPDGWCDIALHGQAAELAQNKGITALSISMSHENDYATAVVIADFV